MPTQTHQTHPSYLTLSESHTVVKRLVFISTIVLFIIINHLWTAGPCYCWPPCTMQCPFHALIVQEHFQLFDSSIQHPPVHADHCVHLMHRYCQHFKVQGRLASSQILIENGQWRWKWSMKLKMVNEDENGQYLVWQRWQRQQDGGEDDGEALLKQKWCH